MSSAARQPFVWKFWGTLVWSLICLAVISAVGLAVVVALAAIEGIPLSADTPRLAARLNPAVLASCESIALLGPVLAVLWVAARAAGQRFSDYLGLRLPSRRHAAIGALAIVATLAAMDGIAGLVDHPVTANLLSEGFARHPTLGMLLLMAVALVVTTPIAEESLFRGFIYRGFAASRLGIVGAVILSSLMFTAMHVQYDAFGLTEVLVSGLLLGTMRAVSGSTLLTMAMHGFVNAVALVEAIAAAHLA